MDIEACLRSWALGGAVDRTSVAMALQAADEIAAFRKDAERYRWLRANTGEIVTSAWDCMSFHGGIGNDADAEELDAAIDAAMASK